MIISGNYYKNIADTYDQKWKHYIDKTLDRALQYFPESLEGKTVLDYGCGTGALINRVLDIYPELKHITGYDPVEEMLHQTRMKIQQSHPLFSNKIDLRSNNSFENKFDIIVSTSVFHYLKQPHTVLLHLKSLLQKDGTLILMDYTKDGFFAKYFEWAIRSIDNMHYKAYKPSQISSIVEKAGFDILQSEKFNISLLWKGFVLCAQ